ncbi:DEAD/DEAH box helicase [Thiohalocapsa marina]|uniref:DEAD/DEAH box helicase n=1 Tax=Thiohalocapsa marina TaxID=424902 RepID=A0A5M8FT43_9GAMM|nr:DEAD/DEAH box helicase [Thiohalocapsa marina]KAA6186967.1 DEAD/DEAH box helicase [Thiohalocapsa marina]
MTGETAQSGREGAGVERLLSGFRRRYSGRITGELAMPALPARFAPLPDDLHPRLREALMARGLNRLYSHQRAAWDLAREGRHLVAATPTASGKTLCYNLPVIDAVLSRGAKALYLFPTKALAQDQVAELTELNHWPGAGDGGLGIKAFTFDGDTPGDARKAVRTRGDIVLSNPDMLHQAILPHHTKWAQFFESLAFIVVDELHSYRGVFGSHVANVFRRLQRICRFYGAAPRFIFASATIANPAELASRLVGEPVAAVTDSGAPRGARHLLLWNPPVIDPDLGIRASARSQTTRIARAATKAGLKNIVFARSRLMVEVITKYLKDVFDRDPRRPPRVLAYRGGYLPSERRATERALRAGRVDCVVSTSALELGVDIGALDVAVLNGYPGTIAATWQRLGRAGRRNRPSLGVLVATSDPLDQYMVRHPEFFLGASPEHARIHPDQLLILMDHVRCAAFELPFQDGEGFGADCREDIAEMLAYLRDEGVLQRQGGRWFWVADSYPANAVSLRSVAEGNFVVIDIGEGRQTIIAEVDYSSAPGTLYEGAIYMVQSQPYQVERLDWVGRKAFVRKTRADYYTDAIDYTRLKILERFERRPLGAEPGAEAPARARAAVAQGEVHLVRRYPGYKKIRYYSHDNIGYGNIDLPDQEMHTTAVWWQVHPQALEQALPNRERAIEGFLGAAYALHHVAALRVMAEIPDLGRAVGDGQGSWFAVVGNDGRGQLRGPDNEPLDMGAPAADRFQPTLFLYDNYPGGVGLSGPLFDAAPELVQDAIGLVSACACTAGCPACVGPVLSGDEQPAHDRNRGPNQGPKAMALTVLGLLRAPAADRDNGPADEARPMPAAGGQNGDSTTH